MRYLKNFILPTILITFVVGSFYIGDRMKYYIGRSYFDYKLLPYGLRPEYYCNPYELYGMKYEFKIVVNGFEGYGEGTACYCDSTLDEHFIIKRITGYYFNENSFFAVCYDTNNKLHYITPFVRQDKENDIVMINASARADTLRGLRYIETPDPITVEDYYDNYNLWRRIALWLKL